MNLFLDTNIFLRYFSKDNEEMYRQSEMLFLRVGESKLQLATSTIVLTEIIFTLKSFYKRTHEEIVRHLNGILDIRNFILIEKTNFLPAYQLYKKSNKKISDCLIVTQIPEHYSLCSFDTRLEKLIGKRRFIHPASVV